MGEKTRQFNGSKSIKHKENIVDRNSIEILNFINCFTKKRGERGEKRGKEGENRKL